MPRAATSLPLWAASESSPRLLAEMPPTTCRASMPALITRPIRRRRPSVRVAVIVRHGPAPYADQLVRHGGGDEEEEHADGRLDLRRLQLAVHEPRADQGADDRGHGGPGEQGEVDGGDGGLAEEPRERGEDDDEGGGAGGALGVEPEPDERGDDEVAAADAQHAAEEAGRAADAQADADDLAPAGHLVRLGLVEEHHRAGEDEEADEHPLQRRHRDVGADVGARAARGSSPR